MQVAGTQPVLTLDIEFTPSLALFLWQSFRKAPWGDVRYYDVVNVWVIAAQVCSTQGCLASSMANSSTFLPALLALDPLQTVPVHKLLFNYQSPSHSLDPFMLPPVEALPQNLLLFAQLLIALAAERNSMFADITPPENSTEEGELLRPAIASRLRELTDVSCCNPVRLTHPSTKSQKPAPHPQPPPSKRVIILRSAVLISKLATLTFNVKADLLGHDEPEIPISVRTLWHSMQALAVCIMDTLTESDAIAVSTQSGNARAVINPWSNPQANKEEQILCVALCEHLIVTLRQGVKGFSAKMQSNQKVACLHMWEALLSITQPDLVGPETKRLGKNPLPDVAD